MSILNSAAVQHILNMSVPAGKATAYNLNSTFIAKVGGLGPTIGGKFRTMLNTVANSTSILTGSEAYPAGGYTAQEVVTFPEDFFVTEVVEIGGRQIHQANAGAYVNINDMVLEQSQLAIQNLYSKVNSAFMAESGSYVAGVGYHIDDGARVATWAGKTRSSNAWACSYIESGSLTTAISGAMDTVSRELINNRGSNYNEIWASSDMFEAYESTLIKDKRYVTEVGDSRFETLSYKGRKIYEIPGYSTRMDFVRKEDFSALYLPVETVNVLNKQVYNGLFEVQELARTRNSATFAINIYPQLICRNPFKQGAVLVL